MGINDLQEHLIKNVTKVYSWDYERCLAGDYNSFPVWNGKGETTPYFEFLKHQTVYDTKPERQYNTDLWGPTADKFEDVDFSKIFQRFCCA